MNRTVYFRATRMESARNNALVVFRNWNARKGENAGRTCDIAVALEIGSGVNASARRFEIIVALNN